MVQLIACEGCGHGVYSNEKQCPKCGTPVRAEWVAREKHEIDVENERPEPVLTPEPPPASAMIWSRVTMLVIALIAIAALSGGVLLLR